MRQFTSLAVALGLTLGFAPPAMATVAAIEATAPLQDHAAPSVKTALVEAVTAAAKGAMAMGLPWFRISNAVVLEDSVAVQILASDTAPGSESEEGKEPDGQPGTDSERSSDYDM